MAQIQLTRDVLVEDAVFILQCLRQNQRGGRQNGLADVRTTLANSVTLDLSDYVAFLRRFGYVDVDARAAALKLTVAGDKAATGSASGRVHDQVGEHFAPLLAAGRVEVDDVEGPGAMEALLRSAGLGASEPAPQTDGRTEPRVDPRAPQLSAAQAPTAELRAPKLAELPPSAVAQEPKPLFEVRAAAPVLAPAPRPAAAEPVVTAAPVSAPAPRPAAAEPVAAAAVLAPPAPEPLAPLLVLRTARLSPVEGELGQGALGRVRAARFGELELPAAVKEFKPLSAYLPWLTPAELSRRVQLEARAQAKLAHPCVLPILDVRAGERPLVVYPLAAGGSLAALLARVERLPLGQALRLSAQTAHALAHAHELGVTHAAVKPENVLLDGRGNALVSDFGGARLVAPPEAKLAVGDRAPRVVIDLGDAPYRAPELAANEPALPASDAYAFGALLYRMLTGQLPGRRSPVPSLVRGDCPRGLDDLVEALLSDEAQRRPPLSSAAAELTLALAAQPLYLL